MTSSTTTDASKQSREWQIGLCLLIVLGAARVHLQVQSQHYQATTIADDLWWNTRSESSVQQHLTNDYCQVDGLVLCGLPTIGSNKNGVEVESDRFPGGSSSCHQYYGDSLMRLWELDDQQQSSDSCAVKMSQFQGLESKFVLLQEKSLSGDTINILDEDSAWLVRIGLYTYLQMWWLTERHIGTDKQFQEDRRRMLHRYLINMMALFVEEKEEDSNTPPLRSPSSHQAGWISKRWAQQEFIKLMRLALHSTEANQAVFPSQFFFCLVPQLESVLDEIKESSISSMVSSPSTLLRSTTSSKTFQKHAFHLFLDAPLEQCLYHHYESQTLISSECRAGIQTAPAKIKELRLESGGDFLLVFYCFFYGMNGITLIIGLLAYGSAQQRMERKMEGRRWKLEQELTDPFLRQCLEKKLSNLSADEQARILQDLEDSVDTWDSKARAQKMLNRQIRNFRRLALLTLGSSSCVYGGLWTLNFLSMARCVESLFLSTMITTLAYLLPFQCHGHRSRDDTEVKMGGGGIVDKI